MAFIMEKVETFSSCRGVSSEIQPEESSPVAITAATQDDSELQDENRVWLPRSCSKAVPSKFSLSERSMSHTSSHFCDLDLSDQDDSEYELVLSVNEGDEVKEIVDAEKQPHKVLSRPKKSRIWIMLFDQGLFTFYKRLFMVCLSINIMWLVLAATGHFPYARKKATLLAIGNIVALCLCRSEALLRFLYWSAVKVLGWSWVPLPLKTVTTSFLHSLGGVHSGCGVSSILWLVYSLVLTLKDRDNTSTAIIAVASLILALLCITSLAAFPLVRHLHHNVFEHTHRFAGWTALGLVWAFLILTLSYDPVSKFYDNLTLSKLIKSLEFWFTSVITIIIILPWITVRRIRVQVTAPASGHASIIKFEGGVKPGILGRISLSPLSDWHAFGIVSDGKKEHMMLAGAVGDFTKSLVSNPPTHLWVRQVYFAGVTYLINMYDRVQLVATGSGVSVLLSFVLQPCAAEVSLLWITRGIEHNFGKEIQHLLSRLPNGKVTVYDTAVSGRPNVSLMTIDAARSWRAQVVIVTSNPEGSRDVINACKRVGLPAFGPIWDS